MGPIYYEVRQHYVEAKFARDTQRGRLEWLRAKAFAACSGSVTERRNAVDVSEDLARKGQEWREMTRDLDRLRADIDLITMMVRLRGALASTNVRAEEDPDGDEKKEEGA